jgi:hypothetical protein
VKTVDQQPTGEPGREPRPSEGGRARSLATVCRYYDGCSQGDIDMMVSTLHADVVHYFLDPNPANVPITGAEVLAQFWVEIQARIDGHWLVDNLVGDDQEAVVEWSLFWSRNSASPRVVTRGSEWFAFKDGLIVEIRSYYQQLYRDTELRRFDYAGRGYAGHGREWSAIHAGGGETSDAPHARQTGAPR